VRTPSLEETVCPLCRQPPGRVVRRAESWLDDVPGRYEVRACQSCDLWITSPRPSSSDLRLVYPHGYYRTRIDDARYPPAKQKRGNLLDVGCGVGDSLVQARSDGWRCVGIEISEEAAAVARARGFEVIVGDATTVPYPARKFDVVRCWHTLEHVPDPAALLDRLREALSEAGLISLLLPNRRSGTSLLFRRYWYHLDLPRHLHHFQPYDVAALAAASGLRVTRIRHTASPSGFLGSIDCCVAGVAGRERTRFRSRSSLRWTARFLTWWLARLRLADVVEYELAIAR
jgi:SAM-dependent methyltransferase